jgi:hypothetical protein
MNMIDKLTYSLLVIGGLNWALVGFFDYNLVDKVFSNEVSRIIYSIVGIAALYGVFTIARMKTKAQK